ncbi:MAG: DUF6428 family protein [Granulosicoccus sp.]
MKETELDELMRALQAHPDTPLRFYFGGVSIHQGYHLTEVKHASITSMDCGKTTHAWEELLIQLIDGNADSTQGYISTSKFTDIVGATLESLPENSDPSLFFEFSPNHGPLLKLKIQSIDSNNHELSVHLTHEKTTCKPIDRWGKAGPMLDSMYTKFKSRRCCSG